jgi:hypothetical protein
MEVEGVGQPDGVVAGGHADVDVLPEHRELLAQVAVALVEEGEALAGADAPLRPVVEGVGAAAADGDVVALAVVHQHLAQPVEVGGDGGDVLPGREFTSIMLSVISSLISPKRSS